MKLLLISLASLISAHSFAWEVGCFEEHITTAKKLNLERKEAYKEITNGESAKVTRTFIAIQDLLIPTSHFMDKIAKKRREAENPKFFCQEFISMSETPAFSKYVPATTAIPEELKDKSYSSKELRSRLKEAFKDGNFARLLDQTQVELHRLEETPSYFCMTRHFLESIARASHFAQTYNEEQKELSIRYINMQIFGMRTAGILDTQAAPLQEKGIAMLCQDIPKIPIE